MTDRIRFDHSPNAEFADRLERDLLHAVGARPATALSSTTPYDHTPSEEDQLMTLELDSDTTASDRRPKTAWKWLALTAAAIALLAAIALIIPDRGSDQPAVDGGVPVTFVVRWAYSDVTQTCAGSSANCLNHFDIPASADFTGDVVGDGFQAVYWNAPIDFPDRSVDHLEHIGTYLVTATISGCGTGQFMLVELMQFVSGADRDRDTGTYKGTWQIVDGSGRDELSNISGSGTSDGVFGTASEVGRTFTGTLGCPSD